MSRRTERIRLDASKLPLRAAEIIASELAAAAAERGTATLCLSGGTTPRQTYESLARCAGVPWNEVRFYFGDERCVAPDHADSNYRMARVALFEPAGIHEHSVARMRGEDPLYDEAARDYERTLPGAFDVLVLGIGEDGHTASLFPHSPALREARRVVHVVGDKAPPHRLTITPRAIESARLIVVLASGRAKAQAVQRALEGELDVDSCPAQIARGAIWLLDSEAAAGLSGKWP